jgi:hypothetical protein
MSVMKRPLSASDGKAASTKPKKKKKKTPPPALRVFVVDNHDDVLQPLCDAMAQKVVPLQGLKVLHYDSHPDMGLPELSADLLDRIYAGDYDVQSLKPLVDVATWMLPLVWAGHLQEIIWVCGSWCHQMDPGTYHLLIGRDECNSLKVASQDPLTPAQALKHPCLRYWAVDGGVADRELLKLSRPWTLHVVQSEASGKMSDEDCTKILSVLGNGPWLLDVDEDYFTCSNPHREKFCTLFGQERYELLQSVYGLQTEETYYKALHKIVEVGLFREPLPTFLAATEVKEVAQRLGDEGLTLVKRLRKMCINIFKEDDEEERAFIVPEFYAPDELHHTGMQVHLPYNISKLETILGLANDMEQLLQRLSPPHAITVATSRDDRYVLEVQAYTVHCVVMQLLKSTQKISEVVRLDVRKLSIEEDVDAEEDEPEEDLEKLMKLFPEHLLRTE